MNNTHHLKVFTEGLKILEPLNKILVYTGGSVISTYIDQPEHITIRETYDIDCVIQAYTRTEYEDVVKQLKLIGFSEDSSSSVICRFTKATITLDLMLSTSKVFGFSNRWYEEGCENKIVKSLDSIEYSTFTTPFFLATKIEAFLNRGEDNFRESHDMEDIVAILDGCSKIADEVSDSPVTVRTYLIDAFEAFNKNPYFNEALEAHISNRDQIQVRKKIILDRIHRFVK